MFQNDRRVCKLKIEILGKWSSTRSPAAIWLSQRDTKLEETKKAVFALEVVERTKTGQLYVANYRLTGWILFDTVNV